MHAIQIFIFLCFGDVELCGQRFACKVRGQMFAGKGSTNVRVRAKLAGKASRAKLAQKHAVVKQPIARCITGHFCSVCKPDYSMALAMGLHPRLGEESPVSVLTDDQMRTIIEMTRPKRQLPDWMCCGWPVRMYKRRRAVAVLYSSRAAKRKRELEDTTPQASSTDQENERTPTAPRSLAPQKK